MAWVFLHLTIKIILIIILLLYYIEMCEIVRKREITKEADYILESWINNRFIQVPPPFPVPRRDC